SVDAAVERVAVRAGNALDAFFREHPVERAAGAAVAVQHVDPLVTRARLADLGAHGLRDALRPGAQMRREAGEVTMVPAVQANQRQRLARQRAAGDQKGARRGKRSHGGIGPVWAQATAATCAGLWLCRLATKVLAVSTATAASRQ